MRFILLSIVALSTLAAFTTARPLVARAEDVVIPKRIVAEPAFYKEIQGLIRLVDEDVSVYTIKKDWEDFFEKYEKSHYSDSYYLDNIRNRGEEKTTVHAWKDYLSYLSSLAEDQDSDKDHDGTDTYHDDTYKNDDHSNSTHSNYMDNNPHPADGHEFIAEALSYTTTSTIPAALIASSSTPPIASSSTPPIATSSMPPIATSSMPPIATTSTAPAAPIATTSTAPISTTSTAPAAPIATTSTAPAASSSAAPISTTLTSAEGGFLGDNGVAVSTSTILTSTSISTSTSSSVSPSPNANDPVTYGELQQMLDEFQNNLLNSMHGTA